MCNVVQIFSTESLSACCYSVFCL